MDIEDELALERSLTAINQIFKDYGIKELRKGDHPYTALLQYLNRERKRAEPRNPVGRPKSKPTTPPGMVF